MESWLQALFLIVVTRLATLCYAHDQNGVSEKNRVLGLVEVGFHSMQALSLSGALLKTDKCRDKGLVCAQDATSC